MEWDKVGKRSRMSIKGSEPIFPGGKPGKGLRLGKARPLSVAKKLGGIQRMAIKLAEKGGQKAFEVPEARKGKVPPRFGPRPTHKELSKAFKMRGLGKLSREINDAFPHIKCMTTFMNRAKDHPDYCQSSLGTKKNIVLATDLKVFKRYRKSTDSKT